MKTQLANLFSVLSKFGRSPEMALRHQRRFEQVLRARTFARTAFQCCTQASAPEDYHDPLTLAFNANQSGPGIWKWDHYLPVYHRHFQKFVGTNCCLLEVGIFSGGSLRLWRDYLGRQSKVIGVDIESACAGYRSEGVEIYIGDQSKREFWKELWKQETSIDIVIDDGGHTHEQMIVTLEETLPKLNPGGVFVCEDIHGTDQPFWAYIGALIAELSTFNPQPTELLQSGASPLQQAVYSIHCYPFALVIERCDRVRSKFTAPRHGTEWQPFL